MREIVSFTKEIEFKTMVHSITGISLEHTLELKDEFLIQGDFIVSGTYKMTGASRIEEEFNYKVPVDISIDEKYTTSNLAIDIYDFTYEVLNEDTLKLSIELALDNLEAKEPEEIKEDTDNFASFEEISLDEEVIRNQLSNSDEDLAEQDFEQEINIIDIKDKEDELLFKEEETIKDDRDLDLFEEINNYQDLEIPIEEEPVHTLPIKEEKQEVELEQSNITTDSIFMAMRDAQETYSTYRIYIVREGDTVDEIINKYKIPREKLEEYNNLSNMTLGSKLIIPSTVDE